MQNKIVGNSNDLLYVNNNIRDYRNYIHLHLLVDKNVTINKKIIKQIHPYFEKLIKLF